MAMDGHRTDQEHRRPGRPSQGANLVASVASGSSIAKARLEAILRTLEGEWTIEEACDHLAIKRSAFHKMRSRFLEEATTLLEPRKRGPKQQADVVDVGEVEGLHERIRELEIDVFAARTREDLALAGSASRAKPKRGPSRKKKRKRRSR